MWPNTWTCLRLMITGTKMQINALLWKIWIRSLRFTFGWWCDVFQKNQENNPFCPLHLETPHVHLSFQLVCLNLLPKRHFFFHFARHLFCVKIFSPIWFDKLQKHKQEASSLLQVHVIFFMRDQWYQETYWGTMENKSEGSPLLLHEQAKIK